MLRMASSGCCRMAYVLLLAAAALCCLQEGHILLAQAGPCSTSQITIPVRSVSQLKWRLKYPERQTVKLVLQNNLWARATVLLGQGFSCTILTSATSKNGGFTVGYAKYGAFPLLQLSNVSNVVLTKIRFDTGRNTALCDRKQLGKEVGFGDPLACAAIFLYRTWGITLSHLTLTGRVDIFRTTETRMRACTVAVKIDNLACLRIGLSGDGTKLLRSQIIVEDNKFSGGIVGIVLFRGAVGVRIMFNELRNHYFAGIQCGMGTTNVGDCMLNTMSRNLIEFDPEFEPNHDGTGFYFDTHWVNPGNYLSCNYVIGGKHCVYLDFTSSGVVVNGAVCAHNLDGIKLNSGHNNIITSVLTINQTQCAGWYSCQNWDVNNCLTFPGNYWEKQRKLLYNSPAFKKAYPWLNDFCSQRSVNGFSCNPTGGSSASQTGGCTGMPTRNVLKLSIVDAFHLPPWSEPNYRFCDSLPNVPKMNSLEFKYYYTANNRLKPGTVKPPWAKVGFLNAAANDFGLTRASVIRQQYPGFKSCPRSRIGPRPLNDSGAFAFFNIWRKVPLSF